MKRERGPAAYPKPGPVGGVLIREVIRALRALKIQLPLTSHILIATSSGADSTALAHLITKYGRRAVPAGRLSWLHINHGWRGEESDQDARFIQELGERLGVPVIVRSIQTTPTGERSGDSLEDVARSARKKIFAEEAKRLGAIIFTAHQADDVAETLLWRIFTGAAKTHGAGIAPRHGVEIRPLLAVRKAALIAYLNEEGQAWREDSTNLQGRFLRSKMRLELMPIIERLFPRAVVSLLDLANEAQVDVMSTVDFEEETPVTALLQAEGLKLRRPHFEALLAQSQRTALHETVVHLPGGWVVRHDPGTKPKKWIIEVNNQE